MAIAQHGGPPLVAIDRAGRDIPVPEAEFRTFEHETQLLFAVFQRPRGHVLLRGVATDAENPDQPAIFVVHRYLGGFQHLAMAVGGEGDFFLIDRWRALFHGDAIVFPEEISQGRADEVIVGLADDLALARPEILLESRIAGQIDALRILQPDQIGKRVDQGAQHGALAHGCLLRRSQGLLLFEALLLIAKDQAKQHGRWRVAQQENPPRLFDEGIARPVG